MRGIIALASTIQLAGGTYLDGEVTAAMNISPLQTQNLNLVFQTRDGALAQLEQMEPGDRGLVSSAWLALLESSAPTDPWIHGFLLVHREDGNGVGQCGFTGPPGAEGVVEIAYAVAAEHESKGYATEAAAALVRYAFDSGQVRLVRAHTLSDSGASGRVLTKCCFRKVGQVMEPD